MLKNTIILLISCLLLVLAPACKKSCAGCSHGGSCSGNTCSCPDPYSGNNCDTMCDLGKEGYMCNMNSKSRFFGAWNCTSSDALGNKTSYLITFTDSAGPSNYALMYMNNFNNKGYSVVCIMEGKYKFDIDQQNSTGRVAASVSGYVDYQGTTMTLYMEENGQNFFGTASAQ